MSPTQVPVAGTAPHRPAAPSAGDALRAAVYAEFLYGFGAAPGLDLGAPTAYSRIRTASGTVYRQDFQRGVTFANVGASGVELDLDPPLYGLDGAPRDSLHLPARGAEILLRESRVTAPRRAS